MITSTISYKAPAKINASLRILGKREDGFHELETVMVPISLCDELLFTPAATFSLRCETVGVPVDESNLVVKAVHLFEERTGQKVLLEIELKKNIPHGAGLGGGSSDAATTLKALNEIYKTGISIGTLAEWGGELGSDVPFFLFETNCFCRGRGEKIEPLSKALFSPILLIKPDFGVPTPSAYKAWAQSQELEGVFYGEQRYKGWTFVNDLERPVFEKYLFLAEMKKKLLSLPGVEVAMMSGSGSTLFLLCCQEQDMIKLEYDVRKLDKNLWIWRGNTLK